MEPVATREYDHGLLEVMEDRFGNYLVFAEGIDVTDQLPGLGEEPETLLDLAAELWGEGELRLD